MISLGSTHPLAGLRIGVIGKGGSGKSTLSALPARMLIRRGYDVVVFGADSTRRLGGLLVGLSPTLRPVTTAGHPHGGAEMTAPTQSTAERGVAAGGLARPLADTCTRGCCGRPRRRS